MLFLTAKTEQKAGKYYIYFNIGFDFNFKADCSMDLDTSEKCSGFCTLTRRLEDCNSFTYSMITSNHFDYKTECCISSSHILRNNMRSVSSHHIQTYEWKGK